MKFIHTIGESGRTCKNTLNLLKYKFLMGWLALNFTDLGNVYWDNKETLEDKLIVNYLNVSNINADDMYILYDAASDERKQKSKIYKRKLTQIYVYVLKACSSIRLKRLQEKVL